MFISNPKWKTYTCISPYKSNKNKIQKVSKGNQQLQHFSFYQYLQEIIRDSVRKGCRKKQQTYLVPPLFHFKDVLLKFTLKPFQVIAINIFSNKSNSKLRQITARTTNFKTKTIMTHHWIHNTHDVTDVTLYFPFCICLIFQF